MLIVGNMRYQITIQSPTAIKNDFGEIVETYVNTLTLRAVKKEVSGSVGVDNQEVFSAARVDFETYYRPTITTTNRVVCNGKKYRINYVQEQGFRESMILQCEIIND